jgi:tetratricopeptide (TPR) repeat protein
VLAVITWVQVDFWSDSETVYRRALLIEPLDPRASYRLGSLLVRSGRLAAALPHLQRATELAPGTHFLWNDLGATRVLRDKLLVAAEQICGESGHQWSWPQHLARRCAHRGRGSRDGVTNSGCDHSEHCSRLSDSDRHFKSCALRVLQRF